MTDELASIIAQRLGSIETRLDRIDSYQRDDIGRVHDKIEQVTRLQAAAHDRIKGDHESRIRVCERYIYRQAGQVAVVGGAAGFVSALLVFIGRLFLRD